MLILSLVFTDDFLELNVPVVRKERFYNRMCTSVSNSFNNFIEDFTEEPVTQEEEDPDGEPLAVKTLVFKKKNQIIIDSV